MNKFTFSTALRSISTAKPAQRPAHFPRPLFHRQHFHVFRRLNVVKPFLLADIGEGITECQLIQWFVQPGARVEQFDKLCEVQSDKASVEITSPFDGVIKKLHYEPDDMAITGKPLVDIDIPGEIDAEDDKKLGGVGEEEQASQREEVEEESVGAVQTPEQAERRSSRGDMVSLATPAVRHLVKEHGLDLVDIRGTGKDGRVLKEDVHRHMSERDELSSRPSARPSTSSREDRKVPLTPVQTQMFKTMTRSLSIPHFLYTSAVDMSAVTALKNKHNANVGDPTQKITHLAFIMKAISLAFLRYPLLNACLDAKDPKKPELTYRGGHNFGIAIDAPSGLLVPVVKEVQDLTIAEIAIKMKQLSEAARSNRLAPGNFSGASFTVSNIGSVGGGVVSPVISEPQVAIVGIGRSKIVPAFNEHGELVKKEELVISWSADHRVVDGAECARCAERVRSLLEDPALMLMDLR